MKFFDFEKEKNKEKSLIGFKSPQKIINKVEHQTGITNKKRDKVREAFSPGKRVSKTGKVYYEYRKNRSDLKDNI